MDRYYKSVAIFLQLLEVKMYAIGTIRTNRVGYCKAVIYGRKTRPKTVQRGVFKLSRSHEAPTMLALSWIDSLPIHFLSTGASGSQSDMNRRR